jgi:hypothetical protein
MERWRYRPFSEGRVCAALGRKRGSNMSKVIRCSDRGSRITQVEAGLYEIPVLGGEDVCRHRGVMVVSVAPDGGLQDAWGEELVIAAESDTQLGGWGEIDGAAYDVADRHDLTLPGDVVDWLRANAGLRTA